MRELALSLVLIAARQGRRRTEIAALFLLALFCHSAKRRLADDAIPRPHGSQRGGRPLLLPPVARRLTGRCKIENPVIIDSSHAPCATQSRRTDQWPRQTLASITAGACRRHPISPIAPTTPRSKNILARSPGRPACGLNRFTSSEGKRRGRRPADVAGERIYPFTMRMNFSKPASCALTMSIAVWSLSSRVAASNFCAAKLTITSGRPNQWTSSEISDWCR